MSTRASLALCIFGAVTICTSPASAGSLIGRTRLDLGAGWRHHSASLDPLLNVDGRPAVVADDGAVGRIGLSYWTGENLAVTVGYTIHDVETFPRVDAYGFSYDEATIVHSLMLGFRLYAPPSRSRSAIRPYFSAEAGPFFGSTGRSEWDDCDCDEYADWHSQVVPMARLGFGLEFPIGRYFTLGLDGRYNFVDRFSEPIGGRYDYSGSEFGVGFSILLGSGRR